MTTQKDDAYKIRPAGRHILTIGRDLIKDKHAAIVELVKNAYDADSPDVIVTFKVVKPDKTLQIIIEDHGHGMTRDTVINKWLVPSTDDKLKRRKSPKGRTMQGRKGIGRYAASMLGEDLLLETVTKTKQKTEVYVEWKNFQEAKYLDEVDVLVETKKAKDSPGTKLTISGNKSFLDEWDKSQIESLEKELKKLISPVEHKLSRKTDANKFKIILSYENFWKDSDRNISKELGPFPLLDLYDYKIEGTIKSSGKGNLTYINQRARNTIKDAISFDLEGATGCGELTIDIRVYDREKEAIQQLIDRGLKDENGNYLGKLEARQLLNQYNGIGAYRSGFRIRPLGDPDFDWLRLNEQRIQNPSMRIGSNQVIGYVQIQPEEISQLEEKSARDGLRENQAYFSLVNITLQVIGCLEERRYIFRQKAGLSRPVIKVERQLEKLFAFDDIKKGVRSRLKKIGISEQAADEIIDIISKKEEDNNKTVEDIRKTIALYQGQATLGKIISVVLHEGRRPLNYFKNHVKNIKFWVDEFRKKPNKELTEEIVTIADGMGDNANNFVNLFNRLDPLAAGKRGRKKPFNLRNEIINSFNVFEDEFINNKISKTIECNEKLMFDGWSQDIYIILTNLIDNSVYWMAEKKLKKKNIRVKVSSDKNVFNYIDYHDTGPGIEKNLLESGVIFDPEFSTKILKDGSRGTGLGLAIAGEAAERNGLELKAFDSDEGVYFRLQIKTKE